jgi:hypothetical protein
VDSSQADFFEQHGINHDRIVLRFLSLLRHIESFVNVKKIAGNIRIDTQSLKAVVCDYFSDIARLKDFHKLQRVNVAKIYAYTTYWLLRRSPLQVVDNFRGSEYINELFATSYLVSHILAELGTTASLCENPAAFYEFQNLIFYNLKFRHYTQQSLELMIEAFICGYRFKK